jgi:hypothetical protein
LDIGLRVADGKASCHNGLNLTISRQGVAIKTQVVAGGKEIVGHLRDRPLRAADWAETSEG